MSYPSTLVSYPSTATSSIVYLIFSPSLSYLGSSVNSYFQSDLDVTLVVSIEFPFENNSTMMEYGLPSTSTSIQVFVPSTSVLLSHKFDIKNMTILVTYHYTLISLSTI